MDLKNLIKLNRSYRRFDNSRRILNEEFTSLLDNATKVASAANLQNLRYVISNSKKMNDEIFRCLNWAGYLAEWHGPAPEERPSGYVILLIKSAIEKYAHFDAGIVAQTITLSATEMGLGACIIASINKPLLNHILQIPEEDYSVVLCIAIGKPAEKVVIEPVLENKIQYWRDEQSVHHVPKRSIEEVIIDKYLDND